MVNKMLVGSNCSAGGLDETQNSQRFLTVLLLRSSDFYEADNLFRTCSPRCRPAFPHAFACVIAKRKEKKTAFTDLIDCRAETN